MTTPDTIVPIQIVYDNVDRTDFRTHDLILKACYWRTAERGQTKQISIRTAEFRLNHLDLDVNDKVRKVRLQVFYQPPIGARTRGRGHLLASRQFTPFSTNGYDVDRTVVVYIKGINGSITAEFRSLAIPIAR